MKKTLIPLLVLQSCLIAFGADSVWQGSDGGDIADPANWNGAAPQYDAQSNPDTTLNFNAAAHTVLGSDLTAYRLKFGAKDIALGVDLGSKTLALVNGPVAWHGNGGNTVAFTNGTVTSATRFTFGSGTGLDFCNVSVTANVYCAALNAWMKVSGGSKVSGYWADYDSAKSAKLTVSGEGTVWDFGGYGLCIGGRGNANSFSNSICITDHAVVTNLGGTAVTSSNSGLTLLGNGASVEISNGARLYQKAGTFQIGVSGATQPAYGPDSLRILSGAKAYVRGMIVGRAGARHLLEVAGQGSLLHVTDAGNATCAWGYQSGSSKNTLWVHDHGTVTNLAGTIQIDGFVNNTVEPRLIVEGSSEFKCGNVNFGNYAAYRALLRVDDGSVFRCGRFFVGKEGYARTNTVWVGSNSKITCSGYGDFKNGAASTLVISNGTFEVADGNTFNIYATNTLVLAGTKPMFDCSTLAMNYSGVKIVFDMPKEGFATDAPLIRSRSSGNNLTIGTSITPVFTGFEKFLGSGAEKKTITLMEAGYKIAMTDAVLAKWQAALPEKGCLLALSADGKKLLLTCKPRHGLSVIFR